MSKQILRIDGSKYFRLGKWGGRSFGILIIKEGVVYEGVNHPTPIGIVAKIATRLRFNIIK